MFAHTTISYIKIPHKYNTYITDHINIFKNLSSLWTISRSAIEETNAVKMYQKIYALQIFRG